MDAEGQLPFETLAVELGEIGHERERTISLQPAKLGSERGIPAGSANRQTAPVRAPQLLDLFRGDMPTGKPEIENAADQSDFLVRQRDDFRQLVLFGFARVSCARFGQLLGIRSDFVVDYETRESFGNAFGGRMVWHNRWFAENRRAFTLLVMMPRPAAPRRSRALQIRPSA